MNKRPYLNPTFPHAADEYVNFSHVKRHAVLLKRRKITPPVQVIKYPTEQM